MIANKDIYSENSQQKVDSMFLQVIKGNIGILGVLILISIVMAVVSPNFLVYGNIISVLRQVSNNMYLALGMTLVIILGGIDLSIGSIVAMSGTIIVGLIVNSGLPLIPAILIGLLLGVVVGFLNGIVIANFKVPAFIVTLATMNVAKGIAYVYSGGRSTRITDPIFNMIGGGYLGFRYL